MLINGFIDIPSAEVQRAIDAIKNTGRKDVCEIIPQARFNIYPTRIVFSGLVCKDMGGQSTGIGAESCKNCILKEETDES